MSETQQPTAILCSDSPSCACPWHYPEGYMDEPDEDSPNLAACDYYQGVGICSFGCSEEPSCMTDRPSGGWPDLGWHPMKHANLRGVRLGRRTENWLMWRRFDEWSSGRSDR